MDQYRISLSGLKEGAHEYRFDVDDTFFESFEHSEIQRGSVKIDILLHKNPGGYILEFSLSGFIMVQCDRCLEPFNLAVSYETIAYAKLNEDEDYGDEDSFTLTPGCDELDLSQMIFDYIILSQPLSKIHPDDENGNSTCNQEMLGRLNSHMIDNVDDVDEEIDPRWNELKKLINNKQNGTS
ncbi:MAG: DNA-binding protein [Marinilabiliales bacterium]|nr:MAG: DNA-binding protein [Marinilabiliales bacterium]